MARNQRMNQIYKYENNMNWTFNNMFQFDFEINLKPQLTEEIKRYIPVYKDLFFKDKELK